MTDVEITPHELTLKQPGREAIWSYDTDVLDMLYAAHERFPHMPWTGCEGGVVLIGLGVDGTFDQVITAQPAGCFERANMVEQMISVRDIADDVARGLDAVMSGPLRPALADIAQDQAQRLHEQGAAIDEALVLLRAIADDDRCPTGVRDAAEDASARLAAAAVVDQ